MGSYCAHAPILWGHAWAKHSQATPGKGTKLPPKLLAGPAFMAVADAEAAFKTWVQAVK